ncbi:monovalent cation/H(+) antiporter subunit G [Roseateles sp.]|uniref:monovalent cation/H(+) antiporter subunit G n=1 Tax=Roseateles sp. TaxID=1971397 RepID=UPI00286B1003|nr:monovalent cation/H(+) antiporter subunit G [Roseateles sp.]
MSQTLDKRCSDHWTKQQFGLHELLITLFLFITAPVAANLLAEAALHLRLPSKAGAAAALNRIRP